MDELTLPALLTDERSGQFWTSLAAVLLWLIVDRASRLGARQRADDSGLLRRQARTVVRTVRIITGLLAIAMLAFIWGIDIEGLWLLATSVLTLTGVALFAQWSMLSNVTAYFVLLTQTDFRRGNFVRILEVDNFIEGTIADIGPFQTRLITDDRAVLLVPNNALLARAVFVNPRERLGIVGKLPAATKEPAAGRSDGT